MAFNDLQRFGLVQILSGGKIFPDAVFRCARDAGRRGGDAKKDEPQHEDYFFSRRVHQQLKAEQLKKKNASPTCAGDRR